MASEGVCLDEGGRRSQQCAVVLATVAAGVPSQQLQLLASDALMTQLVAWLHSPADQARRAAPLLSFPSPSAPMPPWPCAFLPPPLPPSPLDSSPADQLREEAFAALDNLGPAARQLFGLEPAELGPEGDGVCAEAPRWAKSAAAAPYRTEALDLPAGISPTRAASAGARAATPPPPSAKPGAAARGGGGGARSAGRTKRGEAKRAAAPPRAATGGVGGGAAASAAPPPIGVSSSFSWAWWLLCWLLCLTVLSIEGIPLLAAAVRAAAERALALTLTPAPTPTPTLTLPTDY